MRINYLFIDPIKEVNSGISQYIYHANSLINSLNISTYILKINNNESDEEFRIRIAQFVANHEIDVIESPETKFATKYINHPRIHIRLHCSKVIGNYFQGLYIDRKIIIEEQKEIDKAYIVTAPSLETVKISSMFFSNLENKVCIIPNPFLHISANNPKQLPREKSKLFFIGTGKFLKGIYFFKDIHLVKPIYFIGDELLENFLKLNFASDSYIFINGNNRDFLSKINIFDIIIVPSIFETWSMVAAEGLSQYARIITWQHIGITNFFDFVSIVQPFDLEKFQQVINNEVSKSYLIEDINSYIKKIDNTFYVMNRLYLDKVKQLVLFDSGENIYQKLNLQSISLPNPILIHNTSGSFIMRLQKKIKKLFNNPKLFFNDSRFVPDFLKKPVPLLLNNSQKKPMDTNMDVKSNTQSLLELNEPKSSSNLIPKIDPIKIMDALMSGTGFLKFPDRNSDKHDNIRAILLFPKKEINYIKKILENLVYHVDFLPLRSNELMVCSYPDSISDEDYLNIACSIDNANKARFSKYPNIFIYDITDNLARAIRSINHEVTVTQVIPEYYNQLPKNLKLINLDFYLIPSQLTSIPLNKRKVFQYQSNQVLLQYIRKIIQETIPRDLNLFLPVIAPIDYRPELINMNEGNTYFNILVKLKNKFHTIHANSNVSNHLHFCDEMALNTLELFVLEKVFLKYQNLLVNPTEENLAQFYKLASQDSLRFKVIYD